MEIRKINDENNAQAILTRELAKANDAYRNSGLSLMSDLEYDKKLEKLAAMEEESGFKYDISPTEKVGATVVSELKKVRHESPALSLDKVKYKDREGLIKWLRDSEGHDSAVISWKNDGLTVIAAYDDGKLTQAVTRGDGFEGSDITHNARYFKGLPQEIGYKDHLVVRGEAVMSFAEFERVNAENDGIYENPRNLASATIQMLDANESKKREIRFIAFELVTPEPESEYVFSGAGHHPVKNQDDRLIYLEELGFNVVRFNTCNSSNILDRIEEWKNKLSDLDYPTDGLVISFNDMVYGMGLGNTGHHFRHSFALKWTDETEETTIRDIEWSVGKTGIITPVAIFDEVRLGLGSNVSRASLHNISVMKRLGVKIGSKAQAYLANLIIPQLTEIEGGDEEVSIPNKCPVCSQPVRIETNNGVEVLHCDNASCPARQVGRLMNTFSKDGLFVKGLGESQMVDLMEAGLVNAEPLSFYVLANEDRAHSVYPKESEFAAKVSALWGKDGWGKKKWENLISAIETSRKTTLQKFLYSLNVPLLGNDLSKKLSKFWHNDITHFRAWIDSVRDEGREKALLELMELDGIGDEKAKNIINWAEEITASRKKYEDFIALINELEFPESKTESSDNSLEGLTFVITGAVHDYKNREEFKASVEARRGKVTGSVSAMTSFLIANDKDSGTGKAARAATLGVPVLTEDEFINKFGR